LLGSGLLCLRLWCFFGLTLVSSAIGSRLDSIGRCPESQVVAEKLHDESAVSVGLLGEGVELGNGVIEGLFGEVACAIWRVEDLVVEDREVESQTKADGVGGRQIGLCDGGGSL
jgi:hypothetical protein